MRRAPPLPGGEGCAAQLPQQRANINRALSVRQGRRSVTWNVCARFESKKEHHLVKYRELMDRLTLEEKCALLSGAETFKTRALPQYDIPQLWLSDGPHGVRKQAGESDHLGQNPSEPATCFPTAAAVANSWDIALAESLGEALGEEAAAQGVGVLLGPGLNIKRNPLCGRNFEYFSEDPLLTGVLASAVIKGVQSMAGCGVTIKHFACNNQEDNRMGVDACVSERALREIYLRGFEIAVKEGAPAAIMSSYNLINGVHAANNRDLCTVTAREEWGFGGVIMSDWNTTVPEDGSIAWRCTAAGNDIIMPGNSQDDENIREAYARGDLSETEIRECAGRIISLVKKLSEEAQK